MATMVAGIEFIVVHACSTLTLFSIEFKTYMYMWNSSKLILKKKSTILNFTVWFKKDTMKYMVHN